MTTIFVPREVACGETRVAAIPETVKRLVKLGLEVTIQAGAGEGSFISDEQFKEAGASIGDKWDADVICKVNPPQELPDGGHEVDKLREGALLISLIWSVSDPALSKRLADRKLSVIAMEAIPRISRAQKMDVLSSQANLAGYKAVLMGANALGQIMAMMVTAAGTIKPARVVVMGAGVAGLQAIATAKRLGAIVEATDIRPEVKEQVESLGGKFIETVQASGEGGYAKELTAEQKQRQQEIIESHLVAADMVVTTALIPGRPAPKLVPAHVVEKMRPGSVIVDLAVSQGGNCELSEPGVCKKHGVTIIGETNVPALLPSDASALYARNVLALLQDIVDRKEGGALKLNLEDEVIAGSLIIQGGEVRHEKTKEAMQKLQEAGA
ncbi:MAG: Re/Si-specific NAD(P)(+) transhydrogenase subunit alpha [Planctomycetota bacterium]